MTHGTVDLALREPSKRRRPETLGKTSWAPSGEMDMATWSACGARLGALGRGVAWWIGDWIRYGNARFGEKYARAARLTGYDVQSLMNMAYVASRFGSERRRATLSWSHHAEVAGHDLETQEFWLNFAERERLSVRSLRTELRSAKRSKADPTRETMKSSELICPHCNGVIPRPSSGG